MELFNTDQYTTGTSYDFEIQQDSSKKGKRKQPIYDPAWDDGSAFPGIKDTKSAFKEGDSEALPPTAVRITAPNGMSGAIQKASPKKYKILWDNGFPGEYSPQEIQDYGYERQLETFDDFTADDVGESWNPAHFDPNPEFKADGNQLTIFLEENGTPEPPEPDDFKTITEYEEAWEQWQTLHNLTSAQVSALGSRSEEFKSEDLNSSELQKPMITAQTSLVSDSQASITMETCSNSPQLEQDQASELILLAPLLPANPSVFKENDSEQMTPATVSPQLSKLSEDVNRDFLPSRTLEDCLPANIPQNQKGCTLDFYSASFPAAGMMSNGSLYPVEPLDRPTLEKGCLWLESPGALSSVGRSPGRGKLENSLMKQGILSAGQVINPVFLEESFGIPEGWTDPSELRTATELLEEDGKHSATHLTPESQRSPSQESSICTKSPLYEAPSESNEIPEKFSEETKKDRRRGCLYKYLENKRLKDGTIASYPRVIGDRNPDNPKDWRWGFNWEEKIDGQWRNRSLGCVPVGAIPMIQSMQKSDVPLQEIIDFIRRSKGKKTTE